MHDRVPVDQLDLSLEEEVVDRHGGLFSALFLNLLRQLHLTLAGGRTAGRFHNLLVLTGGAAQKEILLV